MITVGNCINYYYCEDCVNVGLLISVYFTPVHEMCFDLKSTQ